MNHSHSPFYNRPFVNRRQCQLPSSSSTSPLGESTRDMLNFSIMPNPCINERVEHQLPSSPPELFPCKPQAGGKKTDTCCGAPQKCENEPTKPSASPSCDIVVPRLLRGRSEDAVPVTQPQMPQRWERRSIEVMPFYSLPLAGAKETLHAYRTDRCQHTVCEECNMFLYCIETASMVLCPDCKAISAVESDVSNGEEGLLGLGMTIALLLDDPERPGRSF